MDIALEWLGYLGRWGHVIAAITWIGTSFYFNWLDLSERPPKGVSFKPNVVGDVHEMHGGSFYYHERFWPTEDNPRTLAHSGPAQLTFLTGLLLIFHTYWLGADIYLVEAGANSASGANIVTPGHAVIISILILIIPWLIYHKLCKHVERDDVVLFLMSILIITVSYLATEVFSPRAAFVHVGASLGTIMAANVQYVIIPNHIAMRKQVQAAEPVNQIYHKRAKRRSQHNNYMTLPVVFSMVSVHFPLASSNDWAWLILVLIMASAFVARHYRNIQLATNVKKPHFAILSVLLLAAGIGLTLIPSKGDVQDQTTLSQHEIEIFSIVQKRCTVCHATKPTVEGFASAPGGVRFEIMSQITTRKDQIFTQVIASNLMPPGNRTEMTNGERVKLGEWLKSIGAVKLTNE